MSRWSFVLTLALSAPSAALIACATKEDQPASPKDVGPEAASTLPEVCSTLGNSSWCRPWPGTHLEPRSLAAQEDCLKGIAERRCGEARFLLEKCLDDKPLCHDEAGVPTNDDPARCMTERARWEGCLADGGP